MGGDRSCRSGRSLQDLPGERPMDAADGRNRVPDQLVRSGERAAPSDLFCQAPDAPLRLSEFYVRSGDLRFGQALPRPLARGRGWWLPSPPSHHGQPGSPTRPLGKFPAASPAERTSGSPMPKASGRRCSQRTALLKRPRQEPALTSQHGNVCVSSRGRSPCHRHPAPGPMRTPGHS